MWNPLSRKKMHVPLNCTQGLQTIRWNIKQTISLFIIALFLPSGHNMIKSVYALKEHLRKFVSFLPFTICALLWSTCLEGFKLVFKVVLFKRHFSARSNWIFYSTFNYKTTATYVQKNFCCCIFVENTFLHIWALWRKAIKDVYDGTDYIETFRVSFFCDPNFLSFLIQIEYRYLKVEWSLCSPFTCLSIQCHYLKENIIY